MSKKFYITTPIYYPSGIPHIGTAFTTVAADVLSRWLKLWNFEVKFLTGTDEHGQKILNKSLENNQDPMTYIASNVQIFKNVWNKLNINYDEFIRTTNEEHKLFVQNSFEELIKSGFVELRLWEGLYCISCEESYPISDRSKCDIGHELTKRSEQSYFLKVNQFVSQLKSYYEKEFLVMPISILQELKNNFLNSPTGLQDLAITRENLEWGIKVKSDSKHTIYVWVDALLNYLSFTQKKSVKSENIWQESFIIQFLGKDISRFHLIYWPILLNALKVNKKPDLFLINGWVTINNEKMSKSLNNAADPVGLMDNYGSDALRMFLALKFNPGADFEYSEEIFKIEYNTWLANTYGNLVNRFYGMCTKYNESIVPFTDRETFESNELINKYLKLVKECLDKAKLLMGLNSENQFSAQSINIGQYVREVFNASSHLNKLVDEFKPWEKFKDLKSEDIKVFLSFLDFSIYQITWMLQPVLVEGCSSVFNQLNIEDISNFAYSSRKERNLNTIAMLYPRK